MTSATDQGPWLAIVGTARGAAHVARGLDNQDSVESRIIDAVGGTVVAVGDGHGHDRHFRSATGSRLATRTACTVIAELAGENTGTPWTAGEAGELCDTLPQAIVDEWRAAVAVDIAAHPYTADELGTLERAGDGPEIPYGSTLLVALVAAGWLVCAQIGDGDLVAIRPNGHAWSPVAGDDLLDGHRTTSLCQAGAVASFRTAAHDLRSQPLLALLVGTDGYGNAQARDPWQPHVAGDIAELAIEHDGGWFAQQLPAWAQRCASADGSGDDTTVALLLAPDSMQRAAAARPAVRPDAVTVPAAPTIPITMAAPVTTPVPPPPAAPPPVSPPAPAPVLAPLSSPAGPVYPAGPPPALVSPAVPPPALVPPAPPSLARQGPDVNVPSAPGRHAAPQSRRGRRRLALAGIGAVVAAGAIAAGLVLSQSSGHAPATNQTARPAPKATQTATSTATAGVPAPRATATPPVVAPSKRRPSATPTRASKPAGTATPGQLTQNQGG